MLRMNSEKSTRIGPTGRAAYWRSGIST
jgi:hypothetical protein